MIQSRCKKMPVTARATRRMTHRIIRNTAKESSELMRVAPNKVARCFPLYFIGNQFRFNMWCISLTKISRK